MKTKVGCLFLLVLVLSAVFVSELHAAATDVNLQTSLMSPQPAGISTKLTAQASGGNGSYEYKFQHKVSTETRWTTDRRYRTRNAWTWDTTAYPAGSYRLRVLAREAGSAAPWEARKIIQFELKDASFPRLTLTSTDKVAIENTKNEGVFTILRYGSTLAGTTVNLQVSGTAKEGVDYETLPKSLILGSGETSAEIAVTPLDDTKVETDETVTLKLKGGATYAVGSPSEAVVTLKDTLKPTVTLRATDAVAVENSTDRGVFTVSRDGPNTAALLVNYKVAGTAKPDVDYKALSGTAIIPAGSRNVRIVVRSLGDKLQELDETVVVTLTVGNGYTLGLPKQATVVIEDDDRVPKVFSWGRNDKGQLGNGTNDNGFVPSEVSDLLNMAYIEGGKHLHSLAITNTGGVMAWGLNDYGQLGNGNTGTNRNTPVAVSYLQDIVDVGAGEKHSLAANSAGQVFTWGDNAVGQLGNGNWGTGINAPSIVSGLSNIVGVAAGNWHCLALNASGEVWAWGAGSYGQLGIGIWTANSLDPVQISDLSDVVQVSAGQFHSMALTVDGNVWVWGYNSYGQLGLGDYTSRNVPVLLTALSNIVQVSSSGSHSLALNSNGRVWAWGKNADGQLGIGSTADRSTVPVLIDGLTKVIAVSAGYGHSMALRSNGEVWTWGDNLQGELGTGAGPDSNVPVRVTTLSYVGAISAGGFHNFAIVP